MQPTLLHNIAVKISEEKENQIAVTIPFQHVSLHGHLYLPERPEALVIISHGSGSSRFSPRNNYIAEELANTNIAALLIDLLTPKEDSVIDNRFDIPLLTERLKHVMEWIMHYRELTNLPVGYLGVSTGAASALDAAVDLKGTAKTVVCMGGRTDLVEDAVLSHVAFPTLLIAGGLDNEVIKINTRAFQNLTCKRRFIIVNSASHLFEEPGKLHVASELAAEWFEKYLVQKVGS